MFPSHTLIESSSSGVPAPTFALKWLSCGEWFGIPTNVGLMYPFLKISCDTAMSLCINPQSQIVEVHPDTEVVRIIPETVTFQTSSLL